MNLSTIKNAVTSRAGHQILLGKKYSPQILFGVGVAGFVGTVAFAVKASMSLDEVLQEHEKVAANIESAHGMEMKNGGYYDDEHARKDTIKLVAKTSLKVAKLYAPAIGLGVVSIAALTGSHFILNSRNVALTAAYAAVDKGFKQYRDRVIAEYGPEKDQQLRQDMETTDVVETKADGKTKKTKVVTGANGLSQYAKIFDEGNKNWNRPEHYNAMFLRSQQNYANDLLNGRGHVLLNDVYDMLGFERTKAGCIVGWVKGHGDGYIDFGIFRNDEFKGMTFVKGDERSIILDFNVDGVVYDLLGK